MLGAAVAAAIAWPDEPLESCFPGPAGLDVCPASEAARPTDRGRVPLEPWVVGDGGRSVRLHYRRVDQSAPSRAGRRATTSIGSPYVHFQPSEHFALADIDHSQRYIAPVLD